MNPRALLNFLQTRSGKLLLFGLLLGGILLLVVHFRSGTKGLSIEPAYASRPTNQVIETVTRAMQIFRPPPPPASSQVPKAAPPIGTNPPVLQANLAPPAPISLATYKPEFDGSTNRVDVVRAPYGRLIPCQTVITIDSSSINTPIIGLVTEDIYHAGILMIPAGTEVHGTAETGRIRERLGSGAAWILVSQSGEEMRLNAMALDREFDNEGWGITDGSAGLRGRLIKSDDLAEVKLFAATILSGAASALTEKEQTILGTLDSRSLNNAPFKGAEEILGVYAQRIYAAIERDGFYLQIPSGKQFYLYVQQSLDPLGGRRKGAGAD